MKTLLAAGLLWGSAFAVVKPDPCEKPVWMESALSALRSGKYPRIRAASYWHETFSEGKQLTDLRIDSSKKSLTAYRKHAASADFVTVPRWTAGADKRLAAPGEGTYLGAFPDFGGTEDQVSAGRVAAFENLAGRPVAWAYFSNNWYDGISFPTAQVAALKAKGKVPFLRLMMRSREGGLPDPKYQLQAFVDGKHDVALKKWAEDAKKADTPMLLEFGTEVNGDWFPWSAKFNGGKEGPGKFKETYRRLVRLFREAGLRNVTWFFHLDTNSAPEEAWNTYEAYYPGDDVVDWIGVSVYGSRGGETCEPFAAALDRAYPKLAALSPAKPLAVLEWGITEKKALPKPKPAYRRNTGSASGSKPGR